MGLRLASSSYTSGMPVGMFSSTISLSGMLSRYLTRARRLLPWAAMMTFLPDYTMGAMVSCHSGRKRATVSFRHSVWGSSAGLRSL